MKIVCDSCGAKYSIADEKVAGKIFRIRCKKCSSVLEVRGDQTGAHPFEEPGRSQAPAPDGGWYVVIDGEQTGPLPPIELSQLFAKGSVGLDSYVWKEGFDDWKTAAEVPDLVAIFGGSGRRSQTAKIETESPSSFSVGGDLFSDGNGREPTGEVDTEAGVFHQVDESPSPEEPVEDAPLAASDDEEERETPPPNEIDAGLGAPAVAAAAAPARMTGQRNENSVLFSLSNLQQLASRGGSPAETTTPAQAPVATGNQASGEGSGLIDIRALARSTTPGTQPGASQAVDDLLTIGSSGGGGTLGAPLLGPTPVESSNSRLWLWIAGGAVAVAVVGGGIAIGMALGGSSDDGLEVAAAPTGEATENPADRTTTSAASPATPHQAAPPNPSQPAAAALEESAEKPLEAPDFEEPAARPAGASANARSKQSASSKRRRKTKNAAAAAAPVKAEPAPVKKRSGNLDALMDEVVGGSSPTPKRGTTKARSSSGAGLPASPSRGDVKTALQGVSGAVKSCGRGTSGTAIVDVTFSGSTGRVSRAKVASGPFKGTPVGACVEKSVKRARVPRFKQSSFKVKFPYRL